MTENFDPIDSAQQNDIHDLQRQDIVHSKKLDKLEGLINRMAWRTYLDVAAFMVLTLINIALLLASVQVNITVVPK